MIPIKIQCGCGQRYAFDVEPVNGRMPHAVACPACNTDGTDAANAIIAQNMAAQPAVVAIPAQPAVAAAPAGGGLRLRGGVPATPTASAPAASVPTAQLAPSAHPVATAAAAPVARLAAAPTSAPRGSMSYVAQVDPSQLEHEARAKIMWGDHPEDVVRFLMLKGLSHQEAMDLIDPMVKDRRATIRANAIRKIMIGIGLICVTVVALLWCLSAAFFPVTLLGIAILFGLYGGWLVLNGTLELLNPKLQAKDLADE